MQYTRHTVTGSSTADVLVLLVDARKGAQEQTRRHLAVGQLLRVPNIVVAVNKIDLVDYSQQRYGEVAAQLAEIAEDIGATVTVCRSPHSWGTTSWSAPARGPGTTALRCWGCWRAFPSTRPRWRTSGSPSN